MRVMATRVEEDVSIPWSIFSVVQKKSRPIKMHRSFVSDVLIGPSAASCFFTISRPPGISLTSGGIKVDQFEKERNGHHQGERGGVVNHSSQVMS